VNGTLRPTLFQRS